MKRQRGVKGQIRAKAERKMQDKLKPVMKKRINTMMGDVSDDEDDEEEF